MIRRGMLLSLLCALSTPTHAGEAVAPAPPAGDDECQKKATEAEQDDCKRTQAEARLDYTLKGTEDTQAKAHARNAQPGADPWSVSVSTELFTRPSFRDAFKVSADEGHQYTLSITPFDALPRGKHWWLRGFRVTAGWNEDARVSSAGLAWSASLHDARSLWGDEIRSIAAKAVDKRRTCLRERKNDKDQDAARRKCEESYSSGLTVALESRLRSFWRPAFSLGASVARDHANRQRGHFKASAAIEFEGESGIAVTGNADYIDEPVEGMQGVYTARLGGGVALSYRPNWPEQEKLAPRWPELGRLVLTAGAKYLYCWSECMDQTSPWEFGGRIGYAISDVTVIGWSLLWKDEDLRDPTVGLSFSLTFGKLPSAK